MNKAEQVGSCSIYRTIVTQEVELLVGRGGYTPIPDSDPRVGIFYHPISSMLAKLGLLVITWVKVRVLKWLDKIKSVEENSPLAWALRHDEALAVIEALGRFQASSGGQIPLGLITNDLEDNQMILASPLPSVMEELIDRGIVVQEEVRGGFLGYSLTSLGERIARSFLEEQNPEWRR